jgi:tetratricopeptide (TPR) repeat protein
MNAIRSSDATSVVFVGNCHAESLTYVYATLIAPRRGETVHWVPAYKTATGTSLARIQSADVIAVQVMSGDQTINLSDFRTNARVVPFPFITAFFLWPFCYGAHPADADIPAPYHKPFTNEFGDKWLDQEIRDGADRQTLVDRYECLDISALVNLDRMVELGIAAQKARDLRSDMSFNDYIMSQLTEHRPFIQPHHPDLEMFNRLARETFARIGCTPVEIEAALAHRRYVPGSAQEVPIHPRIVEHFGLRWAPPDLRYISAFGERMTWTQFCRRYVAHDWSERLQTCLARATEVTTTDEAAILATELEGAAREYDSAEGYSALSDLWRRLGRLDAALDAIERALISNPTVWPCSIRRVDLLLAMERPADALAVAQDLAVSLPEIPDAYISLFEAHRQLGDVQEAATIAAAAAAIFPDHSYIAGRAAQLAREM